MESRSVTENSIELSKKFNAYRNNTSDVIEMLQSLSDKGFIEENG